MILENKTVFTHEQVELVCHVKPNIAVRGITWTKENETIPQNKRIMITKHKVVINDVLLRDAGSYTCSVRTILGVHNRTAFLTVTAEDDEEDGRY